MSDIYCQHGQHHVPESSVRKLIDARGRTRVVCKECYRRIKAARKTIRQGK